jgi:biopolymer transport protein ExbD
MGRKKLRFRDSSEGATFELNLAPMLDMFVSIIPFMLLSATFISVMIIDIPIPVPVAQALQEDRKKEERDVSIQVLISKNEDPVLQIRNPAGKMTRESIPRVNGEPDYNKLHQKLVVAKQQYPKIFRLEVMPKDDVVYQTLVRVMDSARNMDPTDPKIMIDGAATPLLFPDVFLANVME